MVRVGVMQNLRHAEFANRIEITAILADRIRVALHAGQYSGQVGPVHIELKCNPGEYDRAVFLVLKEFEPPCRQGGDMA